MTAYFHPCTFSTTHTSQKLHLTHKSLTKSVGISEVSGNPKTSHHNNSIDSTKTKTYAKIKTDCQIGDLKKYE